MTRFLLGCATGILCAAVFFTGCIQRTDTNQETENSTTTTSKLPNEKIQKTQHKPTVVQLNFNLDGNLDLSELPLEGFPIADQVALHQTETLELVAEENFLTNNENNKAVIIDDGITNLQDAKFIVVVTFTYVDQTILQRVIVSHNLPTLQRCLNLQEIHFESDGIKDWIVDSVAYFVESTWTWNAQDQSIVLVRENETIRYPQDEQSIEVDLLSFEVDGKLFTASSSAMIDVVGARQVKAFPMVKEFTLATQKAGSVEEINWHLNRNSKNGRLQEVIHPSHGMILLGDTVEDSTNIAFTITTRSAIEKLVLVIGSGDKTKELPCGFDNTDKVWTAQCPLSELVALIQSTNGYFLPITVCHGPNKQVSETFEIPVRRLGITCQEIPVSLPVMSHFNNGSDGWIVADYLEVGAEGSVKFVDPNFENGTLNVRDPRAHSVWYWQAPSKFQGDWSEAYEGKLSYRLSQTASGDYSPFQDHDVILVCGEGEQQQRLVFHLKDYPKHSPEWSDYKIELTEAAGWKIQDQEGLTKEAFLNALQCVRAMLIRGEYHTGDDRGWIDEVVLTAK